ncbi:MAG: pirin family protein [Chloroflexi bacterium]|nr:pirin family protein [Chloroflexota bacterium]
MAERVIIRVAGTKDVMEGAGVLVHRALPSEAFSHELVDPFLLLDDATVSPDDPGFPSHPHRGFEILTYLLRGSLAHTDDAGHRTVLRAGGLQRITAGRGIWHGESIGPSENGRGQEAHGLQLWVNLAKADKQIPPEYQLVEPQAILAIRQAEGVIVRLLAGERTPVQIHTPILYVDATVPSGASFSWPVPSGWQGFVYVLAGEGRFGANEAEGVAQHILVLGPGDRLTAWGVGDAEPLHFVLAAGQPHREPVHWRGSYVD